MKIGFDVSQTGSSKAGCGFFADGLIRNLSLIDKYNEYLLYPTFGNHFWDNHYNNIVKIEQKNVSYGLTHSNFNAAKEFWQNFTSNDAKDLGPINILHSNNFFCPPSLDNIKIVYTLYDLSFLEFPEYTTEENRLACFRGVFNASINADHIIAISHHTRSHFLSTFVHYPSDCISVCYPASRFNFNETIASQPRLSTLASGKFWLNVGTLEPRKNQKLLLKAYATLPKNIISEMPLVFAGGHGWMLEDFESLINELNLQDHVILLGYSTEEELAWLYQNCFCLVYPSFFEGFGLPVLEAMSAGSVVISSEVSSLPEIVGEAGILIDPNNLDDLVSAMYRLFSDNNFYQQLKKMSLIEAKKFSWEQTAKNVLTVYNAVI